VATVGVLGLGIVGQPIAMRLQEQGFDPQVFEPIQHLARHHLIRGGTGMLATAGAVAQACDVILIAADDDDAVRDIALGATGFVPHVRPGAVVVDMASADPALTRAIGRALVPNGATIVDAPMSGSPEDIEAGRLTLFCSGRTDALERCEPILSALASRIVRAGDTPGAARAVQSLARLYGAVNLMAAAEVLLIGRRFGIEPAATAEAIGVLATEVGSPPPALGAEVLSGRFESGYRFDQLVADMDAALAIAALEGTPAPLSRLAREFVAAARLAFPAARDHSELVRWQAAAADAELGGAAAKGTEPPEPA
jgi:3-hydroxyisobutyrate dehydrogenase